MSNAAETIVCISCGLISTAILIIEIHVISIKSHLEDIRELLKQIKK
jgi:hypothetical protein